MSPRVAVLGTGRMGSAIARRLAERGTELVLWNRTRGRAEDVGVGTVAATPAEAVAKVDVVLTSLTGPEALQPTMFALRDLRKDLDLAMSVFHRAHAHVPMTALVRDWIHDAAAEDPGLDISAVARRYPRRAGGGSTPPVVRFDPPEPRHS